MKKKKKKSLNVFAALVVLVISAFALSACGEGDKTNSSPSFEAASNVKATTIEIIDDFFERVYNNSSVLGTETTYSVEQIQSKVADFEYYVEVGTIKNINEVKSISLNDTSFTENQTFYLSIGNANQLLDRVYYVEESKLYVAAPVVAFETVDNAKIKINNNEFNFDLDVTTEQINLTNVAFNTGANNTASKVSDTEYNLTIKSGTEYAGLYYDGASTSDTIITKRMLNGVLNGYGILNPYNGTNGPCSYLYPVGWQTNPADIDVEKFDGSTFDYSLYIANKHTLANVTLNITIDLANVETYDELVEALDGEKSIINLKNDIDVESMLIVNRKVELNLNGKKLYNTSEIWSVALEEYSIITVEDKGELTITGNGTIEALENDCYGIDVYGGKLIINNGTIIGNIHAVYVSTGSAEIKGGHYAIKQVYGADKPYEFVLNLLDENREAGTASIVVTGGTFEKFNPADCKAEGEGTNFVAEGYTSRLQEGSEDIYEVVKNS